MANANDVYGLRLGTGDDPVAVVMFDYRYRVTDELPGYWARFGERPVLIILLRSWDIAAASDFIEWREAIAAHQRAHPTHRLVFALNTQEHVELAKAAGVEAFYCNHNAFVDETVYRPAEGAKAGDAREFDAIYDARFAPFKRHHLAKKVKNLALVHYYVDAGHETLWLWKVRWWMRHARILNRHERWNPLRPIPIRRKQVAEAYGRARVGLALSEVEGAMLASIQYLLTGLPVVTTPSRGGRDVFFDADNSITVEPDASAVADAVQTMIGRRSDPWAIRARALERMVEHRERFRAYVEAYQASHGVPPERRIGTDWSRRSGEVFTTTLT